MENEIMRTEETFESIKHIDENGIEFWYARELMVVLNYSKWGNFKKVIDRSMISVENSGINILDHFADVRKMVSIGSGAEKAISDYKLTRYACYLIVNLDKLLFCIIIKLQDLRQDIESISVM